MIQTLFDFPVYFKFFIGLFALVNPVGIIPVFISMTSYQTAAARNKTNLTANLSVAIILWISLFLGDTILQLFGISIDSFRIAGGILVYILFKDQFDATEDPGTKLGVFSTGPSVPNTGRNIVQEAIATGRQPHEAARAPRHTSTDLREIEREALRDLVAQHHGSRAELAHRLGISERSLYRKLKSLG